eukprot:14411945-Alexandrium_andersonii.AAC.1
MGLGRNTRLARMGQHARSGHLHGRHQKKGTRIAPAQPVVLLLCVLLDVAHFGPSVAARSAGARLRLREACLRVL